MNAKELHRTTLVHPKDIAAPLSHSLVWIKSILRFWMLDVAILLATALLIFDSAKVFHFHLLFILLTLGAFYWSFQAFAARAIFGFVVATSSLLSFVAIGIVVPEELIEIPMLTTILVLVFVIAHQRSEAEIKLRQLNDTLEQHVYERTAELNASKEHYRKLTELSVEAILIHANQRLLYVNPAGVRLLGASQPEQLLHHPIDDFIHPDSSEEVQEYIEQRLLASTALPLPEAKFMRIDGSTLDVEVLTTDIVFEGKPATMTVLRDITARKQVERAKIEERNIIARDIHDSIGQSLGYLHLKLDHLAESEALVASENTRNDLRQMRMVSADAYQQMRQILAALMPTHSTEFIKMLRNQSNMIAQRGSFQLQIVERGKSSPLSPLLQQQILFICSEALTNVTKHANASSAKIELFWQQNQLSIAITDDGSGFDLSDMPASYGLRVMKERAAQINSVLLIESQPEQGTSIRIQIPR